MKPFHCTECACGVKIGRLHGPGCHWEQCAQCGRAATTCPCELKKTKRDRLPFAGYCPGFEDCIRLNWFCDDRGNDVVVRCGSKNSRAWPDLARLHREAAWDSKGKQFVPQKQAPAGKAEPARRQTGKRGKAGAGKTAARPKTAKGDDAAAGKTVPAPRKTGKRNKGDIVRHQLPQSPQPPMYRPTRRRRRPRQGD